MTELTTTAPAFPDSSDQTHIPTPRNYSPKVRPQEMLERFLSRYSGHTRAAYERDLRDFASWLGLDGPGQATAWFLSLGGAEVNQTWLDFRADLKARDLSPATINRRRATLRSLLVMGRMLGATTAHLEVRGEREERYRDTLGPPVERIRAMLADLQAKARCGNARATRDLAIVCLLFHRGLRRGEVLGLDVEHYDRQRRRVSIKGKGRGGREWVTLSPAAVKALDDWLAVRGDGPGPVFNRVRGGLTPTRRLDPRNLFRVLKAYGIRPHGLRHASITMALEATDGDVTKVQRFSRHADPKTLMIYDDRRQDLAGQVANMLDEIIRPVEPDVPAPLTEGDFAKLTPTQALRLRTVLAGRSIRQVAKEMGLRREALRDTLTACIGRIPRLRRLLELAGLRKGSTRR